jgi:hypothetical protein
VALRGPDPERDGFNAYPREDIAGLTERRCGEHGPAGNLRNGLRRAGFSRQKAPPARSGSDRRAQADWKKGNFARNTRHHQRHGNGGSHRIDPVCRTSHLRFHHLQQQRHSSSAGRYP